MRKPHGKDIDGVNYLLVEMNPFDASAIMSKLLNLLGKPIANIIQGIEKKEGGSLLESDFNMDMIGMAIEELCKRLNEKEVEKLMNELLTKGLLTYDDPESEKEGFQQIKNTRTHFGKYKLIHLFKVVKFSLEVNFEDFFEHLAELKD